jgi:hypothetical protein
MQREPRREAPQARHQATPPARVQAAPAPQVQAPAQRAPQAAPAAQHDRGGRHDRRDDAPKKG